MKTFLADIIPQIQRYSHKLDDLTKLTNQHWVSLDDINQSKRVFIFRPNNQLLISENGIVERGSWEYLGNQSLILETKNETYLLKHGFFDENIIALKLDSTDSYAFFINETKFGKEINNLADIITFLRTRYLQNLAKESKVDNPNIFEDEDIYVPPVASIKKEKIEFTNGVKANVLQDVEGHYFIVSNYNRYYYRTQEAAINAAYILKVTNKISKAGLDVDPGQD